MNFIKTPAWLKWLFPSLLWDKHKQAGRKLYLTFDDGPVPGVTPFVLETLAHYQARATFFCVGENVENHPEVFQQLVAAGHSVGNHTYNHLDGWRTPTTRYLADVSRCREALYPRLPTGQPMLFRPPYGKIRPGQIRHLRKEYRIVMWDILTGDYDADFAAGDCLVKSIRHSRSGSILIFHDSYKAAKNLKYVLPRYLDHFASAGYEFCSL